MPMVALTTLINECFMAILIKLEQKKFGNAKSRNKWIARVVRQGEVDINALAEKIRAIPLLKLEK